MRLDFRDAHVERNRSAAPTTSCWESWPTLSGLWGIGSSSRRRWFPWSSSALAMRGWLDRGLPKGEEFSYDSVEADEPGLIWSRPEGGGWRVGALYQEYPEVTVWSRDEVTQVFRDFVERVERWLRANLGVGLEAAQ